MTNHYDSLWDEVEPTRTQVDSDSEWSSQIDDMEQKVKEWGAKFESLRRYIPAPVPVVGDPVEDMKNFNEFLRQSDSEWSKLSENQRVDAIGDALDADSAHFKRISTPPAPKPAKVVKETSDLDEILDFFHNHREIHEIRLKHGPWERKFKISRIS